MLCTFCGKEINDDSEFCAYCGKPVKSVSSETVVNDDTQDKSETEIVGDEDSRTEISFLEKDFDRNHPSEMHVRHRHRKPVSGMTKAVLVMAVMWTALIGIIMVRYSLVSQNAREAAMAGKDNSAGTIADGAVAGESGQAGEGTDDAAAGASGSPQEQKKEPENLSLKCIFKNAIDWQQINHVAVYLVPGHDAPSNDPAYQLELTAEGYAISDASAGDYTLGWEADGYYSGYENVTVGKSLLTMEKNLIPVLQDPRNCTVMLEWNGDRDLDLCLFDTHNQQYINVMYPIDSSGNFLFEDNNAARRCEVIRIADCTMPQVYTVYVRDDALLRSIASEDKISMMERDGVKVTVATAAGIIAVMEANPDKTSPLWCPLYVYEGTTFPVDNYATDFAAEAWSFYDKRVR